MIMVLKMHVFRVFFLSRVLHPAFRLIKSSYFSFLRNSMKEHFLSAVIVVQKKGCDEQPKNAILEIKGLHIEHAYGSAPNFMCILRNLRHSRKFFGDW